jgi:hypothetical protein
LYDTLQQLRVLTAVPPFLHPSLPRPRQETATILLTGKQSDDINARIASIRDSMTDMDSAFDKEKAEERIASLAGGVARIRVGAATEVELKDKKLRYALFIFASSLPPTRSLSSLSDPLSNSVRPLFCPKSAIDLTPVSLPALSHKWCLLFNPLPLHFFFASPVVCDTGMRMRSTRSRTHLNTGSCRGEGPLSFTLSGIGTKWWKR